MAQNYGISTPAPHAQPPRQQPARYLVVIEAGDGRVARLFLANHVQVGEFSAGSEEVTQMIGATAPIHSATDAAWNDALQGHSNEERASAEVYLLQV